MNPTISRPAVKALLMAAGLMISAATSPLYAADPDAELAALAGKVMSTGPNGEAPSPASVVTLSDDELAKVKGIHATAAIVLHYGGNDWSRAQVDGLKAEFAALGIDVIAVTDAGFKPETQVANIETVMAKKPSIIVSIPVDPVSEAGAYKKAADAGVKLVFMDNVPKGLVAGKDYVSVVSADNYGNGLAAGLLMAKFLKGKGNIGAVFHAADFFVTKQRYEGFKKAISEFPDIKIIEAQGVAGPDFSGDADKVASAMITAHPNIDGIWAVWDVPAEGVISAARSAGKDNLVITTEDLGENVAINMAQGSYVKGLGAQRPYDQGVTEAKLAAYGLLGKKAPDYVALPSLAVTMDNLLDAWKAVYHTDAPADVRKSMN
ncbi:MAG TPA: substrate-binding domain-containing protein [Sphingomicrobium sp.]|nr:substrate-binding domain-containing protein [Sphingomicrobium sp.]